MTPSTILEEFQSQARTSPDRVWVEFADGTEAITVGRAWEIATRLAGLWLELGVGAKDRVVIRVKHPADYILVWLACLRGGLVSVPMPYDAPDSATIRASERIGARLFVTDRPELRPDFLGSGVPDILSYVLPIEDGQSGWGWVNSITPSTFSLAFDGAPWNLASLMYTSGTTGPPKAVMVTMGAFSAMAKSASRALEYNDSDRIHNCLPLYHLNALVVALLPALLTRATFIVGTHFSASGFWKELRDTDATATTLVGSMAAILAARPPTDAERAHNARRVLIVPAPAAYWDLFPSRFRLTPVQIYGLSDAGHVLSSSPDTPPGSCGRPTLEFDCKVVDPTGFPVQPGEAGELVLRPTQEWAMGPGYWDDDQATLAAWRDWWFHTGDEFRQDSNGFYYFVGRLTDSMRRRGVNVSAHEVEDALYGFTGIAEAAAYPVSSPLLEDEVAVAIALDPSVGEIDLVGLVQHLRNSLPKSAMPTYLRVLTELPHTPTLKVRKADLKAAGITPDMINLTQP